MATSEDLSELRELAEIEPGLEINTMRGQEISGVNPSPLQVVGLPHYVLPATWTSQNGIPVRTGRIVANGTLLEIIHCVLLRHTLVQNYIMII